MLCCSGSCFQPRLQTSINFLFETNTFYNWKKIHFYICDKYTPEIMLCFLASCFQPQLETFITPLVTLSSLKSSSDRPGWDMNKSLRHNSLQIWPLPDTNTGQSKASKAGGQQAYSSCFKASDLVWERHRGRVWRIAEIMREHPNTLDLWRCLIRYHFVLNAKYQNTRKNEQKQTYKNPNIFDLCQCLIRCHFVLNAKHQNTAIQKN